MERFSCLGWVCRQRKRRVLGLEAPVPMSGENFLECSGHVVNSSSTSSWSINCTRGFKGKNSKIEIQLVSYFKHYVHMLKKQHGRMLGFNVKLQRNAILAKGCPASAPKLPSRSPHRSCPLPLPGVGGNDIILTCMKVCRSLLSRIHASYINCSLA